MPRGVALTTEEQSAILALGVAKKMLKEIAQNVNKSIKAVRNVLKVGRVRHRQRRRGAKAKFTPAAIRLIVRKARTGRFTARILREELAPNVSVRRIQQVLHEAPDLDSICPMKAPRLTPAHKLRRAHWAATHLERGKTHWRQVIFSDEKIFTLDGPETATCYWADRRLARRWQSKRQGCGDKVMVWAAFSDHGKSALKFVSTRIDAVGYTEILEEAMLPFLEDHPGNVVFQQDNAVPHTATHMQNSVSVLYWPAHSPDCSPIDNAWGEMSRRVYAEGRQFDTIHDLKEAIIMAWDELEPEYLRKLVRSMTRRCINVVRTHGGPSGY